MTKFFLGQNVRVISSGTIYWKMVGRVVGFRTSILGEHMVRVSLKHTSDILEFSEHDLEPVPSEWLS